MTHVMRTGFWDRQPGQTLRVTQSLQRNVVSPLKEVSFGRRITHFRRDFVRSGGD